MKLPTPFTAALIFPLILLSGCSTVSKFTSNLAEKRKANSMSRNPEQMRVVSPNAVFQPIARVEIPQFQGLQTPMVSGRTQRFSSTPRTIRLPHFTPVKVLTINARFALVELANGQRGYLPKEAIASESSILASAQAATPVYTATGVEPLPHMDFSDVPVDQAMLNNIDNIPLPESEAATMPTPPPQGQFETVEGVFVRKPEAPPEAAPIAPVAPPESAPAPALETVLPPAPSSSPAP